MNPLSKQFRVKMAQYRRKVFKTFRVFTGFGNSAHPFIMRDLSVWTSDFFSRLPIGWDEKLGHYT